MKTTSNNILLAAGAIAQLAAAQPHLAPRDYVTEIEYATVVETVTAGAVATSAVVNHANWRIHQHTHHRSTKTSSTDVAAATSQSSVAAPVSSATTLATSAASSPAVYTLSSYANTFSAASSSATSSSLADVTSAEETSAASSSSTAVPTYSPSAYGASTSSSSSPTAYSSSTPSATGSSTGAITSGNTFVSNGIKAGLSGFVGIADTDKLAFDKLAPYLGWYSDYSATTPDVGDVVGIPMLWGSGTTCLSDTDNAARLAEFNAITTPPKMMFGFYEPDCDCPMSSDISDATVGAAAWNSLIAPLATAHGTKLGSPSMCKQRDEDWLTPFSGSGLDADWDVTSIHINVDTLWSAMMDLDYYVRTYNKPVWISEFACVNDVGGFNACTNQTEIDTWLNMVVPYFQNNASVVGYGPSNGEGLGTTWPLTTSDGDLSDTGNAFLKVMENLPETMKTYEDPSWDVVTNKLY